MSAMMGLGEAARILGSEAPQTDAAFSGVSTDTRTLRGGDLFYALQGPNFDAHTMLGKAREKGAVAAVVSRPVDDPLPQLVVADTRLALGRLAAAWRARFQGRLIAITGSNGKTTVKEMVAAILGCKGGVLATAGNLNNDIGVPLTLLRLRPDLHHYAVIEMGANHQGEIAYLSGLARPDVALITNAAAAHLAGFGSVDDVARAKGEIFQGLAADGVAVINSDDHYADVWQQLVAGRKVVTFGRGGDVSLLEEQGSCLAQGRFINRFTLATPKGELHIQLPLIGCHNIVNAMAATAVAIAAGADGAEIEAGLGRMRAVKGRLQPRMSAWGQLLIDDSYNANPQSLGAAMEVLATMEGEKILVLGDMAELGEEAETLHRQAGERARELGIDQLYGCGPLSRAAVEGFGDEGHWFDSREALAAALISQLSQPGSAGTVLVKGSRSAAMEAVVGRLVAGTGVATPRPAAAIGWGG